MDKRYSITDLRSKDVIKDSYVKLLFSVESVSL